MNQAAQKSLRQATTPPAFRAWLTLHCPGAIFLGGCRELEAIHGALSDDPTPGEVRRLVRESNAKGKHQLPAAESPAPSPEPNLSALYQWFDATFCRFETGGLEDDLLSLSDKKAWLQNAENEAWYRVRFGIALDTWRWLLTQFLLPLRQDHQALAAALSSSRNRAAHLEARLQRIDALLGNLHASSRANGALAEVKAIIAAPLPA